MDARADSATENTVPAGWSNRQWLAWSAPAWLGLALALWLQHQTPQRDFFVQINQWAAAYSPSMWSCLTTLGETDVLLVFLSGLLLWRPQAMLSVVAAIPVGGLFSWLLKNIYSAPRPGALLDAAQFHLIGPLLEQNSFPSGHSITAFAAAAAVIASAQRAQADGRPSLSVNQFVALLALCVATALAVGLSRIAVGAHWPVDVLAGASGGWLAGLSGAWWARRHESVWASPGNQMLMGAFLFGLGLWLMARPADYPLGVWAVRLAVLGAALTLFIQFRAWRAGRSGSAA